MILPISIKDFFHSCLFPLQKFPEIVFIFLISLFLFLSHIFISGCSFVILQSTKKA